jgi:hypothetical protein
LLERGLRDLRGLGGGEQENAAGAISEHSLEQALRLVVQCGEFLFAKAPQDFDVVMGVTGTLETMSPHEHKIVKQDYQINRMVPATPPPPLAPNPRPTSGSLQVQGVLAGNE